MGCGECLAKFGLITFNVVFMLSGIAVMATGIFVKVNPNIVNMQHLVSFDSGDDALGKAAWVLIGFGVFVLIVSAFGFFTACCGESKQVFVIVYIAFLVIIFIGEFAGGISAAVFKGKLDDELPDILSKTFKSYKADTDELLTKAWDYVQTILQCCGSQSPKDYKDVNFTCDRPCAIECGKCFHILHHLGEKHNCPEPDEGFYDYDEDYGVVIWCHHCCQAFIVVQFEEEEEQLDRNQ